MKTIKPQRLGVLFRVIERGGTLQAIVSVLVFFDFQRPDIPLAEIDLWKMSASELGSAPLDEGLWKPRGELLVHGTAYAPGGVARQAWTVRAELGHVRKELWIVGDRHFDDGVPTVPAPMRSLPLSYAHAFGGPGYAANPIGKGFALTDGRRPLPNIELPSDRVRLEGDTTHPAGFGPLDFGSPERLALAGTYDAAWAAHDCPGYARDLDEEHFNTAPRDQRIDGYLEPRMSFAFENLHPTVQRLEGRLPNLVARCFLRRRPSGAEALEEVALRADTAIFFPAIQRGVVVHRGRVRVAQDDASDVGELMLALEAFGEPKPRAHYEAVFAQRLDKERGHLYALRDNDLLPALPKGVGGADDATREMEQLLARRGLVEMRARARLEIELESTRERLREAGIDPDVQVPKELPPPEPPPDLDELPELMDRVDALTEDAKKQAGKAMRESEESARQMCAEAGVDFDALVAEQRRTRARRPPLSVEAHLASLREQVDLAKNAGADVQAVEATLASAELRRKLERLCAQTHSAYVRWAHFIGESRASEGGDARAIAGREEVLQARARGESLAGRDLAGFDLRGLDLGGLDLKGAFLEDALLEDANLAGARLDDAVMAFAHLEGASFEGASLRSANLGGAHLRRARFVAADLEGGVLARADLEQADFTDAKLLRVDFSEARFGGTCFRRARLGEVVFLEADLSGADFDGAELSKALFLQSEVSKASFRGADLRAASFVETRAEDAAFDDADLSNLRAVKGSSLARATFSAARMARACLRETDLRGASLRRAQLVEADLSGSDLEGADLRGVDGRDARFVKSNLQGAMLVSANLLGCMLSGATLRAADFSQSNLFRADLLRVTVDEATRIEGAELGQARFKKESLRET